LALLAPHDRLADQRLVRELVLGGIGLGGADDVVLDGLVRLDVAQAHLRADRYLAGLDLLLRDHARALEAFLEERDAGLEVGLLVLRRVVFGVLRDVSELARAEIPCRVVLAPMAGVSVQAFRRQGRRYGAGLVCSEMVSCAGIEHRNEKTLGYLRVATDEHPLAIQIFGSEPAVMAEAARMVEAAGADIVDMNFGCPVRKVTQTGAGANLLEDADLARR